MQSYSLLNVTNGSTNPGFCIYVSDFHLIDECFSCSCFPVTLEKVVFSFRFLFFSIFISLWLYQFYSYKGNEWLLITSIVFKVKENYIFISYFFVFLKSILSPQWSIWYVNDYRCHWKGASNSIFKSNLCRDCNLPFHLGTTTNKTFYDVVNLSLFYSVTIDISRFWRSPMRSHISIDF